MPPIVPAELAFAGDGTPYSTRYEDVYHSSDGGLGQARHVFLGGNGLPERWRDRQRFVIFETGFGLGLNFLATWEAWRESPGPIGRRLHYVAIEKHPFSAADLARLHERWPELGPLSRRLQAAWPPALPGLHRIDLGDVTLTLGFGDAETLLPELVLAADAIYLDGFAPDRNPELWSDSTIAQLRRLAAPGATLASWCVAGDVRRRLASTDFSVGRKGGYGSKREMLVGHCTASSQPADWTPKNIAVIGAGLAGSNVANALATRGHSVTVIDSASSPAAGASGNLAGVFRPLPSADDGPLARILRAGFLLGRRSYGELPEARCGWTGVLHLARDARHERIQREIVEHQGLPADFCRFVSRDEATALAGWPVAQGGWWFPNAGWINPPSLCNALLDNIVLHLGQEVSACERTESGWLVRAKSGPVAVEAVVLANGIGTPKLLAGSSMPIRVGRGQVSHIPAAATPPVDVVVTRLGYVTPAIDGMHCAGATMSADDLYVDLRPGDHVENLFRLDMALPGFGKAVDLSSLGGRVSFRPMSPDRLPIVGEVPGQPGLWICNGFGARGLVFASICAELLAGMIDDEPLPLERPLCDALAPSRFAGGGKRRRRPTL